MWEAIPGTDFHEVGEGYISVTPLHLDMTELDVLHRLEDLQPSFLDHPNGEPAAADDRPTTATPIGGCRWSRHWSASGSVIDGSSTPCG